MYTSVLTTELHKTLSPQSQHTHVQCSFTTPTQAHTFTKSSSSTLFSLLSLHHLPPSTLLTTITLHTLHNSGVDGQNEFGHLSRREMGNSQLVEPPRCTRVRSKKNNTSLNLRGGKNVNMRTWSMCILDVHMNM